MLISKLEVDLTCRVSLHIYEECANTLQDIIITKNEIDNVINSIKIAAENDNKYEICSILETAYYCYSVLLSDVREQKRKVITSIFEKDKKVAEEKKALEKKLDSYPEYANLHGLEERLFQIITHISNIRNNIVWLNSSDYSDTANSDIDYD